MKTATSVKSAVSLASLAFVLWVATATRAAGPGTAPENPPDRQVALSIDDLPAAASPVMSGAETLEMTKQLLAKLKAANAPAVGFVNERSLYYKLGDADDRIRALNLWLDLGFELGNHTFAHTGLNRVSLAEWEDAVIQGEPVIKLLLAAHGMKLRYFRHPYLDTGRDLQTRREAEAFLVQRGYRIAPVTLDGSDWHFAAVYDDARRRGDRAVEEEVVKSYLAYSDACFDFSEKLARSALGREPKQIILLHGNWLEAEHVDELLALLRRRGYRFITLEEALSDDAYGLPNTWVGEEGRGWIEQWAITKGQMPQGEPVFPKEIEDRITALPRPPAQP